MNKICSLDELARIAEELRGQGKAVVHCHGVFDLLHPGHYKHFEAARKMGDVLVVTVTPDRYVDKGLNRPEFNERLRIETLAKNVDIDYLALNEYPTAVKTIRLIRPVFYIKGKDYENPEADLTGEIANERDAVESVGGKLHITDEISFSSTSLLNRHFAVYSKETQAFLSSFRERYDAESVIGALKELSKMRVMVVGDAIIDQYCYCQSLGKSPKENIIPTKYVGEESFAGGSLAAANHMAGFCQRVHLVTCLGTRESHADFINARLKPNVLPKFFYNGKAQTIVKRRFVDPTYLSKLFEVCWLDDDSFGEFDSSIAEYLHGVAGEYDLVLVADFGHGMIGAESIEALCGVSRFLAVNTQTNSANVGFNLITKFPKADYICLDDPEMRLACHDRHGRTEELIGGLSSGMGCRRAAVTHGKFGTVTYDGQAFFRTPALSDKVVDTMGAGDAFLSITAPLVAAGAPMDLVGFVGNAVGALKVQIVGNKESVEPVPLYKFITALLK